MKRRVIFPDPDIWTTPKETTMTEDATPTDVSIVEHLHATGTIDRTRRLLLSQRDGIPIQPVLNEAERAGRLPDLVAVLSGLLLNRFTEEDYILLTNAQLADMLKAQPRHHACTRCTAETRHLDNDGICTRCVTEE